MFRDGEVRFEINEFETCASMPMARIHLILDGFFGENASPKHGETATGAENFSEADSIRDKEAAKELQHHKPLGESWKRLHAFIYT